jgi:steroid delta-isomerase-like uncharacterized protein
MGEQENKDVVQRFIDEVFVRGSAAAVDELVADDFVGHTWGPSPSGREYLKEAQKRLATVLANPEFTIEDMIAEGDRVAVRLTARATQVGPWLGLPASGRRYAIGEIHIFWVRDGRIVEHWHQYDQPAMIRQLRGD